MQLFVRECAWFYMPVSLWGATQNLKTTYSFTNWKTEPTITALTSLDTTRGTAPGLGLPDGWLLQPLLSWHYTSLSRTYYKLMLAAWITALTSRKVLTKAFSNCHNKNLTQWCFVMKYHSQLQLLLEACTSTRKTIMSQAAYFYILQDTENSHYKNIFF